MIPVKPFLVDMGGILHIGSPFKSWSVPEIIVNYWSTGQKTIDFIKAYGPIEKITIEETRQYSGRYCFKTHYLGSYIYIDLIHGPKTESTDTIIFPVLCPKVRTGINTRWHNGRWEKGLKTGWCSA